MLRICAGQFKGKPLNLPPQDISRPSSNRLRQAVFNILNNLIAFEGLIVLDAFAGSGALGLEALSHGASKVVFCEKSPIAQRVLKQNILSIKELTEHQVAIVPDFFSLFSCHSCEGPLVRMQKSICDNLYNLVFLDPPYDQNLETKALQNLLEQNLLAPNAIIVVEQRKGASMIDDQHFITQPPRIYGNCQITVLIKK